MSETPNGSHGAEGSGQARGEGRAPGPNAGKPGRDAGKPGRDAGKAGRDAGKADVASRTLSLVKGEHRFFFRYRPGEETAVLQAVADMANRRDVPFDWFDAAVVSHQLGQQLMKEMEAFLPKKAA
ncbi:MAG: hypothetical protein ACK4PI_04070 [Tepidisphaerales bacterium]